MLGVLLTCATLGLVGATVAVVANEPGLTPTEELGKAIFFDSNLSVSQNQSCATCHGPAAGWTGPDSDLNAHGAVYEGSVPGRFGDRKPPSSAYATQSPVLHRDKKGRFIGGNFWDGRATGERLGSPAVEQALGPFLNPVEQALASPACVVYRVCTASYPVSFEAVWGAGSCAIAWPLDVDAQCADTSGYVLLSPDDQERVSANYDRVGYSIGAYEASPEVNGFTSKFDYAMRGQAKLTQQEQLGRALFNGKGRCAKCHAGHGQQPLFTDFTFDNLGLPKNPENPMYADNPGFVDRGLGAFLASRLDFAPYAAENMGKHKVPTMRNVDLRPHGGFVKAFGHNGYFKSLEGIVHFYNTRDVLPVCPGQFAEAQALAANCWPEPEVADNLNTAELGDLGLTPDQEAAIVAFLRTLSDGYALPAAAPGR